MSVAESNKQLLSDIGARARRLKWAAIACLGTVVLLFFVAIVVIFQSREWGQQDIEAAIAVETAKIEEFRFYDVAVNPKDGTAIAVGSDSSILTFLLSKVDAYSGSTRDDLYSVAFSGDGNVAAAVGENGLILVSTNNGKSWTARTGISENAFNEVALSQDGKTIAAVGDRGLIRINHRFWQDLDGSRKHHTE